MVGVSSATCRLWYGYRSDEIIQNSLMWTYVLWVAVGQTSLTEKGKPGHPSDI